MATPPPVLGGPAERLCVAFRTRRAAASFEQPAAALRIDCGGAVGGKRVWSTPAAGVCETGGEAVCGSWDAAGVRRLCTCRRRLCWLLAVGRWGEKECVVPPPPALVRPAAGVCVVRGLRRAGAGCVQAGVSFAE